MDQLEISQKPSIPPNCQQSEILGQGCDRLEHTPIEDMDPLELEVQSLVQPCASDECFAERHEVLKSVVAGEEEVTCFGEDNSVPEAPNEMGQPHEVLWSGMACPALRSLR